MRNKAVKEVQQSGVKAVVNTAATACGHRLVEHVRQIGLVEASVYGVAEVVGLGSCHDDDLSELAAYTLPKLRARYSQLWVSCSVIQVQNPLPASRNLAAVQYPLC